MATEDDRQENIEAPPQVSMDFGHEGNQNELRCKEKLFKSSTPNINFSKPDLLRICERTEICLEGPTY